MIPIRDDNSAWTFPIVTILLIVINVAVYLYQWSLGEAAASFVYRLGVIPWEITHFQELPNLPEAAQTGFPNVITLITSMFLHGGLLHLLGNMLYLWIFGDNVEAITGPVRFLIFYLFCGLAATITHIVLSPDSTIPMVGASGAISGVMGAYMLRFPRARVHVLIILLIFIRTIKVPAVVALGFWFAMQVMSGLGSLNAGGGTGIAWFAHIGGFLAGLLLILAFERKDRVVRFRRGY